MKKVVSIVAVVAFAVGVFATQSSNVLNIDFSIENMLTCGDCEPSDPRGGNNLS